MNRSAAALAAVAASALFAASWYAIHKGWFGRDQLSDTGVYQAYDAKMRAGQVPYRDFVVEYPPLSLPVFVAVPPAYDDPTGATFTRNFGRVMEACGILLVLVTALSLARLRAGAAGTVALALVGLSPLLVGSVILTRFDLWPALLVAIAVAALLAEADLIGAVALAAAIGAKLFPVVLAPIGLVWVWRRRGRRAATTWTAALAAVTAVIFVPWAIVAPHGLAESFRTQLTRPLQVESLGSSVLIAVHHVFGVGLHRDLSHGSENLSGGLASGVGVATSVLQVLAVVAVWVTFASGPATRTRLVAASAAAVAAFIAFGKVFSPQYLVWLVPLVPLVRGRRGAVAMGLLVLSGALTQSWFPHHYWRLALSFGPLQSWELLARDLTVVALAVALAWRPREGRLLRDRDRIDALQRVQTQG